jgi:hypothetical protein
MKNSKADDLKRAQLTNKALRHVNDLVKSKVITNLSLEEIEDYVATLKEAISELETIQKMNRNDTLCISIISNQDLSSGVTGFEIATSAKASIATRLREIMNDHSIIDNHINTETVSRRKVNFTYHKEGFNFTNDMKSSIVSHIRQKQISHILRIE